MKMKESCDIYKNKTYEQVIEINMKQLVNVRENILLLLTVHRCPEGCQDQCDAINLIDERLRRVMEGLEILCKCYNEEAMTCVPFDTYIQLLSGLYRIEKALGLVDYYKKSVYCEGEGMCKGIELLYTAAKEVQTTYRFVQALERGYEEYKKCQKPQRSKKCRPRRCKEWF